MAKKNHTPNGSLFSPEMKEALRRLKRKEPEVDEIVKLEIKENGGKGHGIKAGDEGTTE